MAAVTSTVLAVAAVAVSAAAAGIGTYMQSQAADAQAEASQRAAEYQAEAERRAGEARRAQVEYDAKRKQRAFASRAAAAGVMSGEGSLLEDEMAFASEAEYAAQLAEYPHMQAGASAAYQARLFGAQRTGTGGSLLRAGTAVGGSLATNYGSIGGLRFGNSSPAPHPYAYGGYSSVPY